MVPHPARRNRADHGHPRQPDGLLPLSEVPERRHGRRHGRRRHCHRRGHGPGLGTRSRRGGLHRRLGRRQGGLVPLRTDPGPHRPRPGRLRRHRPPDSRPDVGRGRRLRSLRLLPLLHRGGPRQFRPRRRRPPAPHPHRWTPVPRGTGQQLRHPLGGQHPRVAPGRAGRGGHGPRERLLPDQAVGGRLHQPSPAERAGPLRRPGGRRPPGPDRRRVDHRSRRTIVHRSGDGDGLHRPLRTRRRTGGRGHGGRRLRRDHRARDTRWPGPTPPPAARW